MQSTLSSWMRGAAASAGVALAVALPPGAAMAGTVSETVNVPTTATNWSQNLIFAGFNAVGPAGQTLDSVAIQLTETMAGTAIATNNGSTPAVGDFVFTNQAKLNAGVLGLVTNVQNSSNITIPVGGTSPLQNIGGSSSASQTFISGLAQFLPSWNATGSDTGSEGLSFTGGNLAATFTDSGALSVLVTYTYSPTPVPEPAGLALLGTALLGLGIVRFKRA